MVKRRRRKKSSKKRLEGRASEAASIAEVTEPIEYNFNGVERINSIPDYNETLKTNFLENIISKYFTMTPEQLEEASNNKNITVIERMIMEQAVQALKTGTKNAFQYGKYLQERVSGKAKERVEHSGPNGQAISFQNSPEDEIDEMLNKMSPKELAAYEKAIIVMDKIKKRHNES